MKSIAYFVLGIVVMLLLQYVVIDPLKTGTFDAAAALAIGLGLIVAFAVAREALRNSGPLPWTARWWPFSHGGQS